MTSCEQCPFWLVRPVQCIREQTGHSAHTHQDSNLEPPVLETVALPVGPWVHVPSRSPDFDRTKRRSARRATSGSAASARCPSRDHPSRCQSACSSSRRSGVFCLDVLNNSTGSPGTQPGGTPCRFRSSEREPPVPVVFDVPRLGALLFRELPQARIHLLLFLVERDRQCLFRDAFDRVGCL
jgi:hypothetical protein